MKPLQIFAYLFGLLALGTGLGCSTSQIEVPNSPYPISEDSFTVDTLLDGLVIPYGIAIVGEEEYFISDRIGKFFHYRAGALTEITGIPPVATFRDPGIPAILHGGLMDISLHPNYASEPWIYIAYLAADGRARVDRFRLRGTSALQFESVFATRGPNYYGNGMRIVWQDSTHFFLNVGGSTLSTNRHPILVTQDLAEDAGKIHRLRADGSVPADNPVLAGQVAPTTIWSFGHRDVQGLYYDRSTEMLYGVEHGPKGGDEFNVIQKGGNYGWPLFTYGINYDGAEISTISEDSAAAYTILPEHYWTVPTDDGGQAIAPACLLKVDDSNVADWNGYFLLGSLAFRRLFKFDRATGQTFGLTLEGRVRTLAQLPGGDILALIERNDTELANGKIVRLSN